MIRPTTSAYGLDSLVLLGPASEALERSHKRRRVCSPPSPQTEQPASTALSTSSFSFDQVFQELSEHIEGQEAFPTIAWNFDVKEKEQEPKPVLGRTPSVLPAAATNTAAKHNTNKRSRESMMRSRSSKIELVQLDSSKATLIKRSSRTFSLLALR